MPDFGGGYAMNGQTARAMASRQDAAADTRASAEEAGYVELDGAQKDADCTLVSGGVSSDKGCCNLWNSVQGAQIFSCGTCTKIKGQNASPQQSDEASSGDSASRPIATQETQPVAR
jgi:hypothetical protein